MTVQKVTPTDLLWILLPTGVLALSALLYLFIRGLRVSKTIADEEDEVTKMLNRSRREDLHNITSALRVTLGHTRRLLNRVFYPMALFSLVGFVLTSVIVIVTIAYRHQIRGTVVCERDGDWSAGYTTGLAALCLFFGYAASVVASYIYKMASPIIGLDVAIQVARDSSQGGFSNATGAMNLSNTCLGIIVVAVYIAVAFFASLIGDYGYGCAYAGSLFTVCGAIGSHVATFIMSAMGNSFAEGMSISLYKVEADTQHRVDGTLRIASNTLQSAAGLPMAIGGTLLDLHALYLLMFGDASVGHIYLIPALASACLVSSGVCAFLSPANHHRGLIRKARASILIATVLGVGLCIAVIYQFSQEHNPAALSDDERNHYFYAYLIGACVQLVLVLSIEFTSVFARIAGEHCDISTTATLNSIASFGSIYAFVALSIVAGSLNTVWWAWGPMATVIALAGGILTLLPVAIAYSNARCVASSALCYSKASLMDPPEQELLEHLLYRCELLESLAHNSIAYMPSIVLICICYALLPATFDEADTIPFASIGGVGLAMLSEGLTRFYFSRTTWRLHHTVSAIVSTGDSRRPSSVGGDSNDDDDDPLKGDRVIGIIAIIHVLMQVLVLFVFKAFIGNTGTVWALMYGAIIVIVNCIRHSAEGALGAAVKNFVVQGGMAYAARYSTQHNNAVQAAASTTPLPMASNIIALSIWRVSVVAFFIAALAFDTIVEGESS